MRNGIKTTEFWIGLVAAILMSLQKALFPDSPFPQEAFMTVATWIAARIGEKTLTKASEQGKRAWQTSEFWIAIGFSVFKFVFPSIPDDVFYTAMTFIIGRPLIKTAKNLGK